MKYPGEWHDEVESTQSLLRERLRENPALPQGYFVLAEHQIRGRGRHENEWISAPGNLQVSIHLNSFPFTLPTWIPLWVGQSLHQSLVRLGIDEKNLFLKWPNDLCFLDSKKVAGILCEKTGSSVIAGIGVNLSTAPVPEASRLFLPEKLGKKELLEELLKVLHEPVTPEEIRMYYDQFSFFRKDDPISWSDRVSGTVHSGIFEGLGEFGEMNVLENGELKALYSEEVQKVRMD